MNQKDDGGNTEGWRQVASLDSLAISAPRYAELAGRSLCVVRTGAHEACVTADTCPHAGASLSAGRVVNGCIECPWHAWEFNLDTGRCTDNSSIGIAVIRSRVHAGMVEVAVDPASGQPLNAQPPRPSAV